ncbi:MAG: YkgJ family cysteine cluster protein [Blautia sp.]|nr:YkgJ family cysteine cluster protein [Blautia sp.]
MIRNVGIEEIWDGRFYGYQDMVRVGCHDCEGCSACCHGMEETIQLDPLDIFRLSIATGKSFYDMVEHEIELRLIDGIILPNLRMAAESPTGSKACFFLGKDGRCGIHPYRPGICRLFPLGRYYENGSFRYFLQKGECRRTDRYKIKLRDWIDVEKPLQYDTYICDWHYFVKGISQSLAYLDENEKRQAYLYILKQFYGLPYETDRDFYEQFYRRLEEARRELLCP